MIDVSRLMCGAVADHLVKPGRPVVPAGGELLWKWFVDLSAVRSWGTDGPNPIPFCEIEAYRLVTGWGIEERHVSILRAMDETFLRHFQSPAPERAISPRPLTTNLFDAMF